MSIVQVGLLAAIVTPFAIAIWAAFAPWPNHAGGRLATSGPPGLTGPSFAAEMFALEPIILVAAQSLRDLARSRLVRLELAVDPGLDVRADRGALEAAVRSVLRSAIQAAPGGHVLVTATTVGGQPHIRITDDGEDADRRARESHIRDAEASIALRGGSIHVEVRTGLATTVTIRLPRPPDPARVPHVEPVLVEHAA